MKLASGAHVHLMGICGTAMASLAGLLKDRGFKVTGSDANPYPPMSTQIEKLGIKIQAGYAAANLSPKPDFVIVGNVISASNDEAKELMRLGIPYASLPQAMGEWIIGDRESIVVAGTHGKTTTTSMMSWVADQCGLEPGFLIGGVPKNFSLSFRNPKGKYFVIEGDEYDTAFFDKVPKFIHYKPRHVILTSVEFDHADIYKDLAAVRDAFTRLLKLIPDDGHLMACADDINVMGLVKQYTPRNVYTYGFTQGDFRPRVLKSDLTGSHFEIDFRGKVLGPFVIPMAGDYNILNATAVVGLAHVLHFPADRVQAALSSFTGVARRQDILGEPGGVLMIEDFAHHPTAVRETVKAVQERYRGRRVFSVFEPRSATSRRKVFQKDYADAFGLCQELLLAEAFDQSKIDEGERFSSAELVADLRARNVPAAVYPGADAIVSALSKKAFPGDVILIMSNGGFDGIYGKLKRMLDERGAITIAH